MQCGIQKYIRCCCLLTLVYRTTQNQSRREKNRATEHTEPRERTGVRSQFLTFLYLSPRPCHNHPDPSYRYCLCWRLEIWAPCQYIQLSWYIPIHVLYSYHGTSNTCTTNPLSQYVLMSKLKSFLSLPFL